MNFSQSVKDKVMNASARLCCVCHRYKGVKIELHHIKLLTTNPRNELNENFPIPKILIFDDKLLENENIDLNTAKPM